MASAKPQVAQSDTKLSFNSQSKNFSHDPGLIQHP